MIKETLQTNQDTNLRTEEHEKLYHEFGYNLPTEEDIEDDEFNDWVHTAYEYETFEPTFIDKLRYKISSMPKWQVILLFGCVIAVDICLTMLAIYLYNCIN